MSFLSRVRGKTRFCSQEHYALYQADAERLALEAIELAGASLRQSAAPLLMRTLTVAQAGAANDPAETIAEIDPPLAGFARRWQAPEARTADAKIRTLETEPAGFAPGIEFGAMRALSGAETIDEPGLRLRDLEYSGEPLAYARGSEWAFRAATVRERLQFAPGIEFGAMLALGSALAVTDGGAEAIAESDPPLAGAVRGWLTPEARTAEVKIRKLEATPVGFERGIEFGAMLAPHADTTDEPGLRLRDLDHGAQLLAYAHGSEWAFRAWAPSGHARK
ncbi:MAG: hypothetical protein ABI165_15750, partial [Bryobacteraceae bacterium]